MTMTMADAPIARLFTSGQLECLVRTAAEAVHGSGAADHSDLSRRQIILAQRAYDALMAECEADSDQPVPSLDVLQADAARLDGEIRDLLGEPAGAGEVDISLGNLGAAIEHAGRRLMILAGNLATAIARTDPRRERQLLQFAARLAEAVDCYAALDEHDPAASSCIAGQLWPGITLAMHVLQAQENLTAAARGSAPSPPPECVIQLGNGGTIRTDSYDSNPAGSSYVRVCAPGGGEVAYWVSTEWAEDPQLVMGAILGAAISAHPARRRPGPAGGSRTQPAGAQGTPRDVSDEQVTAWIAAAFAADGHDIDVPDDDRAPDLDEIADLARAVLDEHGATHPIRTMELWPREAGPRYDLITVDQPDQHRICLLDAREFLIPGGRTRQALAALLDVARAAAARLDTPGQDDAARPGRHVPEGGAVLTYGDEESAWLALGDVVHDVFSGQASDLNNSGLLAQVVYLVQELGLAETRAALAGLD